MPDKFVKVSREYGHRLIHPKPAILVISRSLDGRVNAMTAAWSTPLSWDPPLVCVSISPKRYTHKLIKESREFTLNVLGADLVKEADYFGTVSGRDVDKFKERKLTLLESKKVKTPHLAEALAVLECSLYKEVEAGDHTIFIGLVEEAYVKPGLMKDSRYDPRKAKILMHLGDDYYTTISDEVLRP